MILGIDASNIRRGGGVTHLVELLRAASPEVRGFSRVVVWGAEETLARLDDRAWLAKKPQAKLEGGLLSRSMWQRARLSGLARQEGCDVLFVPGGSFAGDFHPVVTTSRNMLPFEWRELRRFGFSLMTLKLLGLRVVQARTFRRANALIFLTHYARDEVMRVITSTAAETTIIPHGIDARFFCQPREQARIGRYSADRPFRILYVSTVDMYKHQWRVAEAVAELRAGGVPVDLDLVGPAYAPALRRLNRTLATVDPSGKYIRYVGPAAHDEMHRRYAQADLCVFASSCENMPNILLEGMASGLPIACSNRGPMPEVLGDGGVYFDPESAPDIARAVKELIDSPELRSRVAAAAFGQAKTYSWDRCAAATLDFLAAAAERRSAR